MIRGTANAGTTGKSLDRNGIGKQKLRRKRGTLKSICCLLTVSAILILGIFQEHLADEYSHVVVKLEAQTPSKVEIPSNELRAEISGWNAKGVPGP